MPRILGVDIPNDKPTHISLRYLYGIGPTLALRSRGFSPARSAMVSDCGIAECVEDGPEPAVYFEPGRIRPGGAGDD